MLVQRSIVKSHLLKLPVYTCFPSQRMASLKRKAEAVTRDPKKPKHDASITSFFGAPKVTQNTPKSSGGTANAAAAPEPAPVSFDKDKWVATLTPEQKELLKLEIDTLDPSWLSHLKDEVTSKKFLDLKRFLQKEIDSGQKIFPPLEEVYSWSVHQIHATPLP